MSFHDPTQGAGPPEGEPAPGIHQTTRTATTPPSATQTTSGGCGMAAAAHRYARAGWQVFPLKPRGKTPATPNGFKDATLDPAQIDAWWAAQPDSNIGIAIPEGVVVIDIDESITGRGEKKQGMMRWQEIQASLDAGLPATVQARSGGGGRHILLRTTLGTDRIRNTLADHVDVKKLGGYIVAPPSFVAQPPWPDSLDGKPTDYGRYRFIDGSLADISPAGLGSAPAALEAVMAKPTRPAPAPTAPAVEPPTGGGKNTAYVAKAISNELGMLRQVPEGGCTVTDASGNTRAYKGRATATFEVACNVFELAATAGISATDAEDMIREAARATGLPEREIDEQIDGAANRTRGKRRAVPPPLEEIAPAAVLDLGTVNRTADEQNMAVEEACTVFAKWLGREYDRDALLALLAALAAHRLGGDPVWLLIVSGSGAAKTETVNSAHTLPGAHAVSTIASEGALLSATARKERAKNASGGVLREIGSSGILIIKDFTSIISSNSDMRATVLAALREIYDGHWTRKVGTDGGQSLEWAGRITTVGAVTTAWDSSHAVVAAMGDRFILKRIDSSTNRLAAGRQAIRNTGEEKQMRAELAEAINNVLKGVPEGGGTEPTSEESETILAAADLVTRARTAVELDRQGNPAMAHAPEMPTRFAKQLTQILRGGVAAGMAREDALRLAIQCARDSMPPLRLEIIDFVAAQSYSSTADVRKALNKPRTTVDRELQCLQLLGVLVVDEAEDLAVANSSDRRIRWYYSLDRDVDPSTLRPVEKATRNVSRYIGIDKKRPEEPSTEPDALYTPSDKSGDISGATEKGGSPAEPAAAANRDETLAEPLW